MEKIIEDSFEKNKLHLYRGNSENILNTFENNFFDSVIIDPPYGYSVGAMEGKLKKVIDIDFNRRLVFELLTNKTKADASFVIFGRGMNLYKDACILEELGWKFKEEIVWHKIRNSQPYMRIHRTHELALVFMKGNKTINEVWMKDYYDNQSIGSSSYEKLNNDYKTLVNALKERGVEKVLSLLHENDYDKKTITLKKEGFFQGKRNVIARDDMDIMGAFRKRLKSVISVSRECNNVLHSTQKPVYLMSCLVELASNENEKVLDCFMGSGSTGEAAIINNREFYGIELFKEYYDLSKDRLTNVLNNVEACLF